MSNIRHEIIMHVNKFDDPVEARKACIRLIKYSIVMFQTITDNNKLVSPPHDVYPLSHGLAKQLFNKKDPLDKQILELEKKGELDIKVVELKGPGVKTSRE